MMVASISASNLSQVLHILTTDLEQMGQRYLGNTPQLVGSAEDLPRKYNQQNFETKKS